jgi:hypothetical protein
MKKRNTKAANILSAFESLLAAGLIDNAADLTAHMSKSNAAKAWCSISRKRGG